MFTSNVTSQKRKWYFGPLTILAYITIGLAAFVGSVFADTELPPVHQDILLAMPATTAPPPEPPAPTPPAETPKTPQPDLPNPDAAPKEAPEGVKPEPPERPKLPSGLPPGKICLNCVPGGTGTGPTIGNPPPPPAPPPVPDTPVPVGGKIEAPTKTKHVSPVYPPIAQSARVSGMVIVEATIDVNGRVIGAKVLKSVPLLDQAALEAVRQWVFTPTKLNGQPVAVIMTVVVNFNLQESQ